MEDLSYSAVRLEGQELMIHLIVYIRVRICVCVCECVFLFWIDT